MTTIRTRLPLYFAYGSNMDVAQMRRRVPGSRLLGAASLKGHEFVFSGYSQTWGGSVANVKKRAGKSVFGVVYELPPDGIAKLDRFEGYPTSYQRKRVTVSMRDVAAKHVCQLYYKQKTRAEAPPSPAYVQTILAAIAQHGG